MGHASDSSQSPSRRANGERTRVTCDAGVGELLLEYGRQLEEASAAQAGSGFSGMPEADALISKSPNAFLLGVLFTQGIHAERAWSGPYLLRERLGTLELEFLAAHLDAVTEAVQRPPMLHRFKETLPRWICSAARRLLEEYEGSASGIWPQGTATATVIERLEAFEGIGHKKAVMATGILVRHFGVSLAERDRGQVAYDVHVRRVFLRAGLVDIDSLRAIESAAGALSPAAPDMLDLAAWLVGRDFCRPHRPLCDRCRLSPACPRLVERNVEGVGSRRRGAAR